MNLAKWSVTHPVAVTMRIAALVLLGLICAMRLPVDLLPRVDIPIVSVTTTWPNTPPEVMEAQITRPIEQAVAAVPGLYDVISTSTLGSSNVRVQLQYGVDVDIAAVDVLQYVQKARVSFPQDPTLQDPVVSKFDPSSLPILVYGVTTKDNDLTKLLTTLTNDIEPPLEAAGGVAAVTATGGSARAIIVDADVNKLQAYGVSLTDIENRITQENLSLPAGIAARGGLEYTIRAEAYTQTVQAIAAVPLATRNGSVVPLGAVATVRDASLENRVFTRLNGTPAVALAITKQQAANTIDTDQNVRTALAKLSKTFPNIKYTIAYQQAGFIKDSIQDLKNTAIIGGVLAIVIITFFLRNLRSTLVVALSIPISIVSTFAILYFGGFTLNTISLSGLALATGLIVDDAIVVLENIFRHMEGGHTRVADAAVSGAQEILGAVVASTLTIMVVFLPLFLIKGQSGQTFSQLALVVIFSIAVSLLDATTVVPMLASRFISQKEIDELEHPEHHRGGYSPLGRFFLWTGAKLNAFDKGYHRVLEKALRHRWLVVASAIALTLVALPLVPLVGFETLPQTDSGDFQINLRMPIGTSLQETNKWTLYMENLLKNTPDVETYFMGAGANVSFRGAGGALAYRGGATVHLKANRKHTTQQIIDALKKPFAKIPGRAYATPYDLVSNTLSGSNTGIEVDVFGQNMSVLSKVAHQVVDQLQGVNGLESVDIGSEDASPEVRFAIDRAKSNTLGVTFSDVANAVSAATAGELTTYFQDPNDGNQYPIYVEMPVDQRRSIPNLLNIPVKSSVIDPTTGNITPAVLLRQVATIKIDLGPNEIDRLNRLRYIAVTGRPTPGHSSSQVQEEIGKTMDQMQLPEGVHWDFGDQQKRRAIEFAGLGMAVFLAISLIYTLLASQFESFIYPLIVLCSVPLCAPGVIVGLLLAGQAFGLTAYVGVLMLVGIVVKNGILLVDYTNQLRERGMPRDEALLKAAPTRLRPILMTSLCAILGMLPLALSLGSSSTIQAPLATAVVGGLLTSTCLTLLVVPAVYTFFDDLARRFRKDDRDLHAAVGVGPSIAATGGEPDDGEPLPPEPVRGELR